MSLYSQDCPENLFSEYNNTAQTALKLFENVGFTRQGTSKSMCPLERQNQQPCK